MANQQRTLDKRCIVYVYNRLSPFEHLHTRFEIIIPLRGRVRAQLNRHAFDAGPGDILAVFPGMLHCYETDPQIEGVMLTFYEEMLPELGETLRDMQPAQPLLPIAALHRDVAYCIDRFHEIARGTQADEALLRAYLTLLFTHLAPRLEPQPADPSASKELLYRAMKYMSQHLAQPLSLKGTARALGVNSYYLSHVLSERIHMGFRRYLNAMRVDRARRYLRLTSWSIEEIAAACSFGTLRTFDRVFFDLCGCTPREFRKAVLAQPSAQPPAP